MELWTGKQLFSVMLCPRLDSPLRVNLEVKNKKYNTARISPEPYHFCPDDGWVCFRNGEHISGVIDKSIIGGASAGFERRAGASAGIERGRLSWNRAGVALQFESTVGWRLSSSRLWVGASARVECGVAPQLESNVGWRFSWNQLESSLPPPTRHPDPPSRRCRWREGVPLRGAAARFLG